MSAFFAVYGHCQTKTNMLNFDYSQIFKEVNTLGYIGNNFQRLYTLSTPFTRIKTMLCATL